MRVKLLKKVRILHNWYFKKDGFPVIIDHMNQKAYLIDFEYCLNYYNVDKDVKLEISQQEWAMRALKRIILTPYGYSHDRKAYRIAMRNLKRKQKNENSQRK